MKSRTVYWFAIILALVLAFRSAWKKAKKEKYLLNLKKQTFEKYKNNAYRELKQKHIFDFILNADSALSYREDERLAADMLYYQMLYDTTMFYWTSFWDIYDLLYSENDSLPLFAGFYDLYSGYCYDAKDEIEIFLENNATSSLAYSFYAYSFICNSYDTDTIEVLKNIQKAISLQPDFYTWYVIGKVYTKLEQYKNAIFAYKQSIKEDSNYFRSYEKLYLLYKKIKRSDSSKYFYTKFSDKVRIINPYYLYENIIPDDIGSLPDTVIEVDTNILNGDTGLLYINNILNIQPDNEQALLSGAKLKYKKGIYDAAMGDFMDYYDLTNEDSVLYYIARCWIKLGNPEMAYETLNSANSELDEKSAKLKDSLEKILY